MAHDITDIGTHVKEGIAGVLNDPLSWPEGFNQALPAHLEVNPPLLLLTQLAGFSSYRSSVATSISSAAAAGTGAAAAVSAAAHAEIVANQVTVAYAATGTSAFTVVSAASSGYAASGGPTLTSQPDGSYIIFYGFYAGEVTPGQAIQAGINLNGVDPGANYVDVTNISNTVGGSISKMNLFLAPGLATGGTNSFTLTYTTPGGFTPGSVKDRWILAIRYSAT